MRLLSDAGIVYRSEVPIIAGDKSYQIDILVGVLAIEVDGASHRGKRLEKDEERDGRLLDMGIRTLRVKNGEVFHHVDQVLGKIREALQEPA